MKEWSPPGKLITLATSPASFISLVPTIAISPHEPALERMNFQKSVPALGMHPKAVISLTG